MRKNARWAQSSVSAILGGGGSGYGSSGFDTPVPDSPTPSLTRRVDFEGGDGNILLSGRWGRRGQKGRSIQVGIAAGGVGEVGAFRGGGD